MYVNLLRIIAGLALSLLLVSVAAAAPERVWKLKGKQSVSASYVRMDEQTVVLKKQDGKFLRVPLDELTAEDRDYVRAQNLGKLPGEGEAEPPTGAPDPTSLVWQPRTWTDTKGKQTLGVFVAIVGRNVQLKSGGATKTIPMSDLSKFDLDFMRANWNAKSEPAPGRTNLPVVPVLPEPEEPASPAPIPSSPANPAQPPDRVTPPRQSYEAKESPVQGLNIERWWHTRTRLVWGKLQMIELAKIQVTYEAGKLRGAQIPFKELPTSEVVYVLNFLRRSGEEPFARQIVASEPSLNPANLAPDRLQEPALPERELITNDLRYLNKGYKLHLARILSMDTTEVISSSAGSLLTIEYRELTPTQVQDLQKFAMRCKAIPLAEGIAASSRLPYDLDSSSRQHPGKTEMREWQLQGRPIMAKIDLLTSQGIDLYCQDGSSCRMAFEDLAGNDVDHLRTFFAQNPTLNGFIKQLPARSTGAPLQSAETKPISATGAAPVSIGLDGTAAIPPPQAIAPPAAVATSPVAAVDSPAGVPWNLIGIVASVLLLIGVGACIAVWKAVSQSRQA